MTIPPVIFQVESLSVRPSQMAGANGKRERGNRTYWQCLLRMFRWREERVSPWLSIPKGLTLRHGITLMLGESGSGKSVLLSLLAGYPIALQHGKYEVKGLKIGGKTVGAKELSRLYSPQKFSKQLCKAFRMMPCIFLPQRFPNIPKGVLTVRSAMKQMVWGTLGRKRLREIQTVREDGSVRKEIRELLRQGLRNSGLFKVWKKDLSFLSGGERQRVELLTRLVSLRMAAAPMSILLLDEPTTGLDSENSKRFFELLAKELKECEKSGHLCAVVVATHEPQALPNAHTLPLITITNATSPNCPSKVIVASQYASADAMVRQSGIPCATAATIWENVYRLISRKSKQ